MDGLLSEAKQMLPLAKGLGFMTNGPTEVIGNQI